MKKKAMIMAALAAAFIILHITPSLALRTQVFIMGYPKAAIYSGIIEDTYHNEVDQEKFAELNAKAYTLTRPPIEEATQGELRNYLVKKVGFLYFAEYYGEL
ncbi:hypothetical protein JOC78_000787 [Bacillus ectoiniformans]|uniref:hypothetical protein n=1 Tax=Bacillus ectoiniformans TaxID=1494429 RepID=UPI00195E45C2|nr:hypothetical protein [Bacillus ectoiniformans]MBM7647847.1 hypothetical protein [Bacillus ectoiniformans]